MRLAWLLLAFWPVWPWYLNRVGDGSDEPWGLLALLVLALLLWKAPLRQAGPESSRMGPERLVLLFLTLYALLFFWLPDLLKASLAVLALAALAASGRGPQPGIYGLALLSLPLMASLQFYLGYPLRWLIGLAAALMLRGNGLSVVADGAALRWGDQTILIDAPCSGIRMLWVAGLLACLLIYRYQLDWGRALLLGLAGFGLVLLANLSRAVTLFYFEAGIFPAVPGVHTASGLVAFALLSLALLKLSERLRQGRPAEVSAYG